MFKLAEFRAVLRYAGLKYAGNKSRVLQSVRDVITQNTRLAIAYTNVIYTQVYKDRVRVPTSTIQKRRVNNR